MKGFYMKGKNLLNDFAKYVIAPSVSIIVSVSGLYFGIIKGQLENTAQELKNAATAIETQLKQREFDNDLKMKMYLEVKEATLKKDKDLQQAVLLIINELLADDSTFRDKLVTLLTSSPNTHDSVIVIQKMIEAVEKKFVAEQEQLLLSNDKKFIIDIFYLEDILSESKPRATKILTLLKQKYPNYQIRLRLLPRIVNARSGYRISENQLRYDSDEESQAKEILQLIIDNNIFSNEQPLLKMVNQKANKSNNYLSIFVRNM